MRCCFECHSPAADVCGECGEEICAACDNLHRAYHDLREADRDLQEAHARFPGDVGLRTEAVLAARDVVAARQMEVR